MQINVDNISFGYLKELEIEINNEIESKKNLEYKTYSLEDFDDMSVDEIIDIMKQNGISNELDVAYKIYQFLKMEKRKFSNGDFFSKTRNEIRQVIVSILDEVNLNILTKLEVVEKEISQLQKKLDFIRMLLIVYGEDNIDINLEDIKNSILDSEIDDDDKFKLSAMIANRLINKQANLIVLEVNEFEQQRKTTIIENTENLNFLETGDVLEDAKDDSFNSTIVDYFNKYSDLFLEFGVFSVSELVDYFGDDVSFNEIINVEVIEKTDLYMFLSSILDKIKKCDNEVSLEKYLMYLEKVDCKFNYWNNGYYNKKVSDISSFINLLLVKIKDNFSVVNVDYELLGNYQNELLNIDKKLKNNIFSNIGFEELILELKSLEEKINKINVVENKLEEGSIDDDKDSVLVKGFVLFDYINEKEKTPYILTDLNYKSKYNLIDKALDGKARIAGFRDFNDLIFDLIKLGKSRYIDSSNPNVADNFNKIVNRIYYDNNNDKLTGMLRIRARINSNLRFCEQTITFVKGTEAFRQVEEILSKYLPNIKIDVSDGEAFQVYVNYASAMKSSDEGLYSVALDRRDNKRSNLVKTFIENFKGKTKLSKSECELFEELVQVSLSTFDELKKQNDNYDFEIVDQLVGGIKHHEK